MPCVVPTCGTSEGSFVLFPRHASLSERWFEAIQVGCGILMELAEGRDLSQTEICMSHFGPAEGSGEDGDEDEDETRYQEPRLFINGNGDPVEIDSCRLCLQFYPSYCMAAAEGCLGGSDIKSVVYESLSVGFVESDFLKLICIECLARLEMLNSLQKDFAQSEVEFQELLKIASDSANDIRNMVKLTHPSVDTFIEEEHAESSSDPDYDLVEEWTPPKSSLLNMPEQKRTTNHLSKLVSKAERRKQRKRAKTLNAIVGRKCYICSTVLEDANELSLHLTENHANKTDYHCAECSLDFPLLATFNRHLSRHEQSERPHKCSFCPLRFKSTVQLKAHENKLHGTDHEVKPASEKCKSIMCDTCGKTFMYKSKLNAHVRVAHTSAEMPTCIICFKSFTAKSSLERHMLLHSNEKPHSCTKCDASFRRGLELRHHMEMVHEGKNPHLCTECNQEFKNYHALYMHKQIVHLKKPTIGAKLRKYRLPCKLCQNSHQRTHDLEQHIIAVHSNEIYPYSKCEHCPRTFLTNQHLAQHKEIHTDKYACKECGKRHTTIQRLQLHMETVHSDVKSYYCTICITKSYKSSTALRQHMASHTRGKQHVCDFCDKAFVRKDQLVIHRRIHTGEKPFQCAFCLKRFSDDATYCKHKKRCQEPIPKVEEENVDDLLDFGFLNS